MSSDALRILAVVALGAAQALRAQAWDDARMQRFFEWGRYDSLLQELSPLTDPSRPAIPADGPDSSRFARAQLYLGVAYFAKNRPRESDQAFRQALRWEPDVKLDPFFVSKPISARFQELAGEAGVPRSMPNPVSGSLPPIRPSNPPDAPAGSPDRSPRQKAAIDSGGVSARWYWGAGALAALAAGGGLYLLMQREEGPSRIETHIDTRSSP